MLKRLLERRDALVERQPGSGGCAHCLVELHLGAAGLDREVRLEAEIDRGLAVGGIGIVEWPGFEAEFVDAELLVVERELAIQPEARIGLAGAGLDRLAIRAALFDRVPVGPILVRVCDLELAGIDGRALDDADIAIGLESQRVRVWIGLHP